MGTRADFYMGIGPDAEWLGSVAWDGYDVSEANSGIARDVRLSKTKEEFLENLKAYFAARDNVTLPEAGWPWPWEDSRTTDFAYAFVDGQIQQYYFGKSITNDGKPPVDGVFPDMKDKQNVRFDNGSGVMFIVGAK